MTLPLSNLPPQDHPNLPRFEAPLGTGLRDMERLDPVTGERVVYTNGAQVAAWLETKALSALPRTIALARHYAALLTVRTQANASGRPGPDVITGAYRASWRWKVSWTGAGEVTARVWTDEPQGRRLEFGFVGFDSLGRVYDQPPFPHLMPAVRETGPEWMVAVEAVGTED